VLQQFAIGFTHSAFKRQRQYAIKPSLVNTRGNRSRSHALDSCSNVAGFPSEIGGEDLEGQYLCNRKLHKSPGVITSASWTRSKGDLLKGALMRLGEVPLPALAGFQPLVRFLDGHRQDR
jgi:hypothetical protein